MIQITLRRASVWRLKLTRVVTTQRSEFRDGQSVALPPRYQRHLWCGPLYLRVDWDARG